MEITQSGDIALVLVDAKFDTSTSGEIGQKLIDLIDSGSKKMLVDFSKTEYISSAGLRVMLVVAKRLQQGGGKMTLACMKPFVFDVFKMSGFDRIFDICDTKEKALANLV